MRGKRIKKLRKEIRKQQMSIMGDFRTFVKELPLGKRAKLAWKVLTKTY